MIDRATIDKVINAADIVDIVGDFVQLKRKGVNYTACCPFHSEKTPSFMVSPSRGIFKCFGCGKAGNAINFIMEQEKMNFLDAIRWVARKYGITIEEKELSKEELEKQNERESMMVLSEWAQKYFSRQLSIGDGETIGKPYFSHRGFTDETIEKFGLGYCPDGGNVMTNAALAAGFKSDFLLSTGLSIKNESTGELYDRFRGRIMFPIHSVGGRVIGFGGRTMRTDKKVAKYQNSPESDIYHKSYTLYGLHLAKQSIISNDKCILVEGYADVIQMHQRGITNVVASSGTSLTVEQIQLIKRFTSNITVIYDGDSAGIKASLRGIDMILEAGLSVKSVLLPEGKDPDDFARENNKTFIEGYIEKYEEDFITFKINILLSENPNDPKLRSDTIRSIVNSIAVIPDAIQRSVYITQCAKLLGIESSILDDEIKIKRAALVDGKEGRDIAYAKRKIDRYKQSTQPLVQKGYVSSRISSISVIQDVQMVELEKELIGYLIMYSDLSIDIANPNNHEELLSINIYDFIMHEIVDDEITFKDPTCREILEIAKVHWDNDTKLSVQELICSQNPSVAELTSKILFSTDQWSEQFQDEEGIILENGAQNPNLSRAESFKRNANLSIAIPKAIILYKSTYLTAEINAIQDKVKELEATGDQANIFELLSQIKNLTAARSILMGKCQRIL